MNDTDTRVRSYLDDLARMLTDLDPADRDEVLAGVREHLDATLADHPDDPAAVDAALLRLGPPERVAAEARASIGTGEGPGRRWDPGSRAWAQVGVLASVGATAPFALSRAVTLGVQVLGGDSSIGNNIVFSLSGFEAALPVATPVWIVGLVLVAVSPRFTRRTRRMVVACGPVLVIGGAAALAFLGTPWGRVPAFALLLLVTLYLALAGRRGWKEASA